MFGHGIRGLQRVQVGVLSLRGCDYETLGHNTKEAAPIMERLLKKPCLGRGIELAT